MISSLFRTVLWAGCCVFPDIITVSNAVSIAAESAVHRAGFVSFITVAFAISARGVAVLCAGGLVFRRVADSISAGELLAVLGAVDRVFNGLADTISACEGVAVLRAEFRSFVAGEAPAQTVPAATATVKTAHFRTFAGVAGAITANRTVSSTGQFVLEPELAAIHVLAGSVPADTAVFCAIFHVFVTGGTCIADKITTFAAILCTTVVGFAALAESVSAGLISTQAAVIRAVVFVLSALACPVATGFIDALVGTNAIFIVAGTIFAGDCIARFGDSRSHGKFSIGVQATRGHDKHGRGKDGCNCDISHAFLPNRGKSDCPLPRTRWLSTHSIDIITRARL
jgi:hypothetical protein